MMHRTVKGGATLEGSTNGPESNIPPKQPKPSTSSNTVHNQGPGRIYPFNRDKLIRELEGALKRSLPMLRQRLDESKSSIRGVAAKNLLATCRANNWEVPLQIVCAVCLIFIYAFGSCYGNTAAILDIILLLLAYILPKVLWTSENKFRSMEKVSKLVTLIDEVKALERLPTSFLKRLRVRSSELPSVSLVHRHGHWVPVPNNFLCEGDIVAIKDGSRAPGNLMMLQRTTAGWKRSELQFRQGEIVTCKSQPLTAQQQHDSASDETKNKDGDVYNAILELCGEFRLCEMEETPLVNIVRKFMMTDHAKKAKALQVKTDIFAIVNDSFSKLGRYVIGLSLLLSIVRVVVRPDSVSAILLGPTMVIVPLLPLLLPVVEFILNLVSTGQLLDAIEQVQTSNPNGTSVLPKTAETDDLDDDLKGAYTFNYASVLQSIRHTFRKRLAYNPVTIRSDGSPERSLSISKQLPLYQHTSTRNTTVLEPLISVLHIPTLARLTALCCVDDKIVLDPVPCVQEAYLLNGVQSSTVIDVLRDPNTRFGVRFQDPNWNVHLASLKPMGLMCLLSTCWNIADISPFSRRFKQREVVVPAVGTDASLLDMPESENKFTEVDGQEGITVQIEDTKRDFAVQHGEDVMDQTPMNCVTSHGINCDGANSATNSNTPTSIAADNTVAITATTTRDSTTSTLDQSGVTTVQIKATSDSKTAESGTKDSQTKTAESGTKDSQTKTAESGTKDSQTKTAESGTKDSQTKTAESGTKDSQTKTAESGTKDSQTKTAESGTKDSQTKTAESGTKDSQTKTAESGAKDSQTRTAESGTKDSQTKTAESGTKDSQTKTADKTEAVYNSTPTHHGDSALGQHNPSSIQCEWNNNSLNMHRLARLVVRRACPDHFRNFAMEMGFGLSDLSKYRLCQVIYGYLDTNQVSQHRQTRGNRPMRSDKPSESTTDPTGVLNAAEWKNHRSRPALFCSTHMGKPQLVGLVIEDLSKRNEFVRMKRKGRGGQDSASATIHKSRSLHLLCYGHPGLLASRCAEYWDGESMWPIQSNDRQVMMSLHERWSKEDFDSVAFTYSPIPNTLNYMFPRVDGTGEDGMRNLEPCVQLILPEVPVAVDRTMRDKTMLSTTGSPTKLSMENFALHSTNNLGTHNVQMMANPPKLDVKSRGMFEGNQTHIRHHDNATSDRAVSFVNDKDNDVAPKTKQRARVSSHNVIIGSSDMEHKNVQPPADTLERVSSLPPTDTNTNYSPNSTKSKGNQGLKEANWESASQPDLTSSPAHSRHSSGRPHHERRHRHRSTSRSRPRDHHGNSSHSYPALSHQKALDFKMQWIHRLLGSQVFAGMVGSQEQPNSAMRLLIEDLRTAGVRFVHFSTREPRRARVVGDKMGLETDWNTSISLRELDENADRFEWDVKAKLPHGIAEIRQHLETVDEVPLLVSTFTDSTPETSCEMMQIMQENGEEVAAVGNGMFSPNFESFELADIGVSVLPHILAHYPGMQNPTSSGAPPVGDSTFTTSAWNLRGNATQQQPSTQQHTPGDLKTTNGNNQGLQDGTVPMFNLSAMFTSLPCSIVLRNTTNPYALVVIIREARRVFYNQRQALALHYGVRFTLAMAALFSMTLSLPGAMLSVADVLWLLCIQIPVLSLAMLFNGAESRIMSRMPPKQESEQVSISKQDLSRFENYAILQVAPSALCLAVLYTVTYLELSTPAFDATSSTPISNVAWEAITWQDASTLPSGSCSSPLSPCLLSLDTCEPSVSAQSRLATKSVAMAISLAKAEFVTRTIVMFATVWWSSAAALTLMNRTESLVKEWQGSRVYLLVVPVVLVLQLLYSELQAWVFGLGEEVGRFRWLSATPLVSWLLVLFWPIVMVLLSEVIKTHDRKRYNHYMQKQRLIFDTRLGMYSPK